MYFLGIDFGTSGARSCVIDAEGMIVVEDKRDFGALDDYERAGIWREALWDLVAALPPPIRTQLSDIALDGTSGTVLACDEELSPRHPPLLYNDDRAVEEAALIAKTATPGHPAAAVTSGLAKVLWLKKRLGLTGARLYLNQADWLAGLLTGRVGMTDYHNALKMGLDLDELKWPAWVEYLADVDYLPVPVAPGSRLATVSRPRARYLGINPGCMVHAGTTDSIAAFLAAGVSRSGDAVTSLGSTLVLKLLSDHRVESTGHGVYSHWFGSRWLTGGASNSGGAVLRQFFDDRQLTALSEKINPAIASPLDYVPLPKPGERFPLNDPTLAPRLSPRPADDAEFLHGLLESLARIEARGYGLLGELGASPVRQIETAGGGARNAVWTRIRQRLLGVPVARARHTDAAYGAALLAREGIRLFDSVYP
ncbi:FGGY-family carbohydrate kinase [Thiobacillus sp.]|uniref:FGGY-family carbohydrate kinase n=1 Tax=Thiobacillus sp. TaxID=924 RepID=UPI0017F49DAD|nr:FGGY-family carbohydrate kinase [Thiobacillus sp.]MBC2731110.1 FGGY-family carbohydrate kinase [Thiobacillus sp.]MBC2739847.1 FGGY-family carbohydrate kinase [Thiobacillus sp.]MBC2758843.1 FGGY-family carbohydrate kinase [Thiobacillus sp.]